MFRRYVSRGTFSSVVMQCLNLTFSKEKLVLESVNIPHK